MNDETPVRCLPCGRRRPEIGNVCTNCRDSLEWRLNDLQELYALLGFVVLPGAGSEEKSFSKVKRDAAPLPGRGAAMNLRGPTNPAESTLSPRDQSGPLPTLAVLSSWVRLTAEERQFAGRGLASSVTSCASFLRRHLDWICKQGWVDDFAFEITRAHNSLRDLCGEHRPQPIGLCPALVGPDDEQQPCGSKLFASTYSDTIACRACGETWTRERWKWLGQTMGLIA